MFNEIWRPVVGYPDYHVSNLGTVKRVTKGCGTWVGRVLKPVKTRGYWHVTLSLGNVKKNMRVHVMVCEAFVGPRPSPYHDAAHCDGNSDNNRSGNLTWKTKVANQYDRVLHGTDIRGERVAGAKLTTESVREIRERFSNGESRKTLASEYGIDKSNVWLIGNRKTWRHVK